VNPNQQPDLNLLYNGQFQREAEIRIPFSNRAFHYNDGFFETIMVVNGKIRFWQDHLDRIQEAARNLSLELPAHFTQPDFEHQLLNLAASNNALEFGRLKLKVWRSGEGLYTPDTNQIEWLATVQPAELPNTWLPHVGLCTSVRTIFSPLSTFKGPNSLLYVMAGLEKKANSYDDVILRDRQGLVSELTSSNIFWFVQDTLFTPSLKTGCINGIMRRNILKWCQQEQIKVKEVFFEVDNLIASDVVFSANVTGVRVLQHLLGFELKQELEIINVVNQKLKAI
jgi:branched-subunit amino acid aminotransferase/4-amino-4-deoxychorismate lyase